MDNLKTTNSIVIRHQPYGERHPYIPLPYERSPRDPSSGEPVILNIETEHSPTADSVWCEWNAAGNPAKNRVDAALISRGENLDHWQAALPAFAGGEEVNYRIFAQNDDQKVKSENYSFEVTTWVSVSSVVAVHESGKHLDVKCATQCSGLFVNLRMELDASSNLSFKLSTCREESNPQSINKTNLSIPWGDLQIALQESPFAFELKRNSDGLVIKSAEPLQVLINNEGAVLNYRLGFASPTDEAFYGFGERFNALDQRGNHLDNYVYGQYTSQGKRTYIPIPFFVSSRRYGLWLKTSRQAQFDLAAASPDCWVLEGQAEDNSSLEMTWFFQPQPYDIIRAFTDLVGKPKTPPAWAFGLWMSSNDWNS